MVVGRESPKSLYSDALVTFEDDHGAYDQKDAEEEIQKLTDQFVGKIDELVAEKTKEIMTV